MWKLVSNVLIRLVLTYILYSFEKTSCFLIIMSFCFSYNVPYNTGDMHPEMIVNFQQDKRLPELSRPFQERRAITCTRAYTRAKVFRRVINGICT